MNKQLKIAAYLRVSTDKQVQVFEGSLDTQKYRMEEFVRLKNKENPTWGEIIDFYVDEGLSAGTVKRPQYQRMMNDVRSGKVNLILVADISRLSRSVHDFSFLLKELEQYNASYMSMKEQFDTTTPAGRLMINMVVNMAQFEREQTSERVAINCNARAIRGYVNGGRTPFGFRREKDKSGTFVVNETEASQVKVIFNTFKDVGSVGKTIPVIEALGIFPKLHGKQVKENRQSKWSYEKLKFLLSNPAYAGLKEVNKKHKNSSAEKLKPWEGYQMVKASWPAIIDSELFFEIQDILEENLKIERRRLQDAEKRIFLLSGILFCKECGKALCGQSAHGKKQIHRYYAHNSKRSRGTQCSVKRIPADAVEQVVINHLTEIVGRAGYFEQLQVKIEENLRNSPQQIQAEIQLVKKSITSVESEISSTFKFQLQTSYGTEAAKLTANRLEELGNQKNLLVNRLLELEEIELTQKNSKELCEDIQNNIAEFKRGFKKAPLAMRRRLLHKVLGKLIFTEKGLEVEFRFNQAREAQVQEPFEKSNGKVIEFRAKKIPRTDLSGSEDVLSLAFEKLRIEGIGWGRRT